MTTRPKKKYRLKKNRLILIVLVGLIALGYSLTQTVYKKDIAYYYAQQDLSHERFEKASVAFSALGSFKDSMSLYQESTYRLALSLLEANQVIEAEALFNLVKDYGGARTFLTQCAYLKAVALFEAGKIEEAQASFLLLGTYKESQTYLKEIQYRAAIAYLDQDKREEARVILLELGNYKDSLNYLKEISYRLANDYVTQDEPYKAISLFYELGTYKDSPALLDALAAAYPSIIKDHGNRSRPEIALTFDDGGAAYEQVLSILNAHGIKATFFLLSKELLANPERWRQAVKDGHLICNHTAHHLMKLAWMTESEMITEIMAWETTARSVLGDAYVQRMKRDFPYFRAPGGNRSVLLQQVLSKLGYTTTAYWIQDDVYNMTHNYHNYTLVENYVLTAKNGDIFLMHQGTAGAEEDIINGVEARGFTFKLLTDLWR